MIQVYKILSGRDRVDREKLLPSSNTNRTRGHSLKMRKRHSRLNVRKHSFGMRVVNEWNSLPDWVLGGKDLNDFKTKIDKCWCNEQYLTRPTHAVTCSRLFERELQV